MVQQIFFMYVGVCLNACLCIMCVQCPQSSEEGIRALELELQTVVSYCDPESSETSASILSC